MKINKPINDKEESDSKRGGYIQKKVTENFILNNPKFDFKIFLGYKNKLIFIPRCSNDPKEYIYIPCLFLRNNNSSNFLIYFHGNSEDIFKVENYGLYFKTNFNMNIIIVEYPGYSIYFDDQKEPKQIFYDSLSVYKWIINTFHISNSDIFIYGRSLGTSPAIYLSSKIQPKALFLVSAFTSIKDIGSDKYLSWFVEDIFNSINYISNIRCPILLIHGEKDSLISYSHSEKLENVAKTNNQKVVFEKRPNMTHNKFDIYNDIITPIKCFMNKNDLFPRANSLINLTEKEINQLFEIPRSVSLRIESEIFNINDFEIIKTIEKKNGEYLIRLIDERIALTNKNIISIYNDRNYILDYDIDIFREIKKQKNFSNNICNNSIIYYLTQMKNENLVCCTNTGFIFIIKIDLDDYDILKHITLENKIYIIDTFQSNYMLTLSQKYIKIFDDNEFKQILSIDNEQNSYYTFVEIPKENKIAFLSKKGIFLYEIKNQIENNTKNNIEIFNNNYQLIKINSNELNHIMTYTNRYIIVGAENEIHFYDYVENKLYNKKFSDYPRKEDILFIIKIHDELILASTSYGNVFQIKIIKNNVFEIIGKNFTQKNIISLLLKNLQCIIIADEEFIKIIGITKKSGESCNII